MNVGLNSTEDPFFWEIAEDFKHSFEALEGTKPEFATQELSVSVMPFLLGLFSKL